MRELRVGPNDAGQRLDRFVSKSVPLLPSSMLQKYIRKKRIKLRGKAAKSDSRLAEGDTIQLYINDEYFQVNAGDIAYLSITSPSLKVIYEDENIMLCDKAPGILSHPAELSGGDSLADNIKAYLYLNRQWRPREENSFAPALCNRLDRNTGGIVIAAKNAPALREINGRIKAGEIRKYYLCAVCGIPDPPQGSLVSYITKSPSSNTVSVAETKGPSAKRAVTFYKTLCSQGDFCLLDCEIPTGRTHQIRAQLADKGHPIYGDVKYGGVPRPDGYQALYAYRVSFDFSSDSGLLNYLKNRSFMVDEIPFVEKDFNFDFLH